MQIICAFCGKAAEKLVGHVNRANSIGSPIYCTKACSGLARRKSTEEKKKVKAEYDKKIRNTPKVKAKRKEYFAKDYAENPEKYKAIRKAKYKKHLQYLQTPKYKAYKHAYDQHYIATKNYGDFAEAAIALRQLKNLVDNRQAKSDQGIFNKSQKRKRNATKNINRKELESCSMGIYQPS